jgi:hypothetical protein
MLYVFSIKFRNDNRSPEQLLAVPVGGGRRLADELMKVVKESYELKSESNPNGWVITEISYDCLGAVVGTADSARGARAISNLRKRFPQAFN